MMRKGLLMVVLSLTTLTGGSALASEHFAVPNDPWLGEQWWLFNYGQRVGSAPPGTPGVDVRAPEAWAITVGTPETVVAILDAGVDIEHPELDGQLWTNGDESALGRAGNGVDDDGNGYIDDVRGWDFIDDDNDPSDTSNRPVSHGTALAGIVAAKHNDSVGITGIAPGVRVMALRVALGPGTEEMRARAIDYAAAMGARVVVMSYAMPDTEEDNAETVAMQAHHDVLFVAAAGNNGLEDTAMHAPSMPCAAHVLNLLCISATDRHDRLAARSNFGVATADLAAPGDDMLVLGRAESGDRGYLYVDGTSLAAPLTAGVAALAWSVRPELSADEVRQIILDSAVQRRGLDGKVACGCRLDAYGAVMLALGTPAARSPVPGHAYRDTPGGLEEPALPDMPSPVPTSREAAAAAGRTVQTFTREEAGRSLRNPVEIGVSVLLGALALIAAMRCRARARS